MEKENRRVMIRLQGVSKEYRLGQISTGTLYRDLQSWWALKHDRDNPNSKIGAARHLSGDRLNALSNIDLTVYEGECLGIIGGNGAGKSTLLKLISRVTTPSAGSIDLYGRVTSMLEVGTGFHGEMTGLENIYLNGAILGMTKREIEEVLDEIIDFSEVREFIDTPVKRYSSGMYVKLAFSVAAHLKSEIVIMDEVLAVGDVAFQKKCIDKMIHAAHDEKRTILYVSHNMKTVQELCDRCIILDQGRKLFDGDAEPAIEYYNTWQLAKIGKTQDLSVQNRRDRNLTGICQISQAELLNGSAYIGGEYSFTLRLYASERRKNMRIRFVITNLLGMPVGMCFSDPFVLEEGYTILSGMFQAANLAAGEYACDIALIEFGNGPEIRHDFVSKVLVFRVEENRKYFEKSWAISKWGNVLLPQPEITGIQHYGEAGNEGKLPFTYNS